MINNVVLVGRIVRDPELKYTPQNQAVATFSLAVNRQFKNSKGEREADFINCVIWRQQAENLANWAKKGALVGVTGRIQTRHYENQQGQRVYITEVVADNFQMLESRAARGETTGYGTYPAHENTPPNTTQPTSSYQKSDISNFGSKPDPFGDTPMEVSDDDLPF